MSYTKQTHVAGQKLTAAQLNYMENGIAAAQNVHNLLDNSNFRNPVNQRGITSQIGGGYGIDRWRADGSGVITVAENGITLNDEISFRQPVRLKAGTYTLAFKPIDEKLLIIGFQFDGAETLQTVYSDETMTGAYINYYKHATGIVTCQFVLSNGYEYTLEWAALYEGSYTAETLPTYVPKGYGAELAECKRYYQTMIPTGRNPYLSTIAQRGYSILLEQEMRIAPTIILKNCIEYHEGTWGTTNAVFTSQSAAKSNFIVVTESTINSGERPFAFIAYEASADL